MIPQIALSSLAFQGLNSVVQDKSQDSQPFEGKRFPSSVVKDCLPCAVKVHPNSGEKVFPIFPGRHSRMLSAEELEVQRHPLGLTNLYR